MQNLNTYLEDKLSEAICNLLFEDKWLKTNKKYNNLYLLIENLIVSYFRNRIYEQNEN